MAKSPTDKNNPEDKRESGARVPIQLLVDYNRNGNYLFDFCRDLGTGGIFIQTDEPQPQGSEIELTFTIPDSKETITTKGTVMWVQNPVASRQDCAAGMGIQFQAFTDEQRKTLDDFVKRYHDFTKKSDQATA